ncbi:transcriptional regulator [Pyrodictium occultum]|uniref:Transcriptional regulator n=1 Tax=Pyrodictium occultum TaxID=2309 RepID=A0A0V8RWW4_PYROC|nr:hypothetical protein [Pyrodictium occultum]KSW12569.1 transcriptional regulator [Pyrodictium occultum]
MPSDRAVGAALIVVSLLVIIVYGWLLFAPPRKGIDLALLKLTAFIAVAGVFGILAWIGYTLATTPPPKPVEEIEKEIEEEIKKLQEELEKEEKAGKSGES